MLRIGGLAFANLAFVDFEHRFVPHEVISRPLNNPNGEGELQQRGCLAFSKLAAATALPGCWRQLAGRTLGKPLGM
jgi:hypothetical protein